MRDLVMYSTIRVCKMLAVLILMPFGCASFDPSGTQSAGPGQAVYHYKKTGDSCEVIITSAREVPGIKANVDENCAVTVEAEALSGEKMQLQMMSIMGSLMEKLP